MSKSIAVVTGSTVPHPDLDEEALLAAIQQRGFRSESVPWDDQEVDWSKFAVAIVRSTWNYETVRDEFVAWAYAAEKETVLLNPASILDWNTDKSYLAKLHQAGLPVVPTTFTSDADSWSPPDHYEEYVVKPNIAGGARNAGRFNWQCDETGPRELVHRIPASGRSVMTQPYFKRIEKEGERVLIFLGGKFSHAVLRGPILGPDGTYVDITRGWKTVDRIEPSADDIELGKHALSALDADGLTYARVDLVDGDDGSSYVLEVELTEPCLFLSHKPGSVDALAELVTRDLSA